MPATDQPKRKATGLGVLYISHSNDPDNTSTAILLTAPETRLGRPERIESDPNYIDLNLDTISREHAAIMREGNAYVLSNLHGRNGIRVYDRVLAIGDEYSLRHGDVFWIPDDADDHLKLLFLIDDVTQVLALDIEHGARRVKIFGDSVKFTPMEYRLLEYLDRRRGIVCDYDALVAVLWSEDPTSRRADLHTLLSRVRAKIKARTEGFTFIETVTGHGVRLVI
jgi:hypothetical protein